MEQSPTADIDLQCIIGYTHSNITFIPSEKPQPPPRSVVDVLKMMSTDMSLIEKIIGENKRVWWVLERLYGKNALQVHVVQRIIQGVLTTSVVIQLGYQGEFLAWCHRSGMNIHTHSIIQGIFLEPNTIRIQRSSYQDQGKIYTRFPYDDSYAWHMNNIYKSVTPSCHTHGAHSIREPYVLYDTPLKSWIEPDTLDAWFAKNTHGKWKTCPFYVTITTDIFD